MTLDDSSRLFERQPFWTLYWMWRMVTGRWGSTLIWVGIPLLFIKLEVVAAYIGFFLVRGVVRWNFARLSHLAVYYDCTIFGGPGFPTSFLADKEATAITLSAAAMTFAYANLIILASVFTDNLLLRVAGIMLTLEVLFNLLPFGATAGGRVISMLAYSLGIPNTYQYISQVINERGHIKIWWDITIQTKYLLMVGGWIVSLVLANLLLNPVIALVVPIMMVVDFFRVHHGDYPTTRSLSKRAVGFWGGAYLLVLAFVLSGVWTWTYKFDFWNLLLIFRDTPDFLPIH